MNVNEMLRFYFFCFCGLSKPSKIFKYIVRPPEDQKAFRWDSNEHPSW